MGGKYDPPLHIFASRLGEFLQALIEGKELPDGIDRIESLENFVAKLAYSCIKNEETTIFTLKALKDIYLTLNTLETNTDLSEEGKKVAKEVGERIAKLEGQLLVLRESRVSPSISIYQNNGLQTQETGATSKSWVCALSNFFKHSFVLQAWNYILLAIFSLGISYFSGQQAAIQQVQKMLPSPAITVHPHALPSKFPH